MTTRSCIRSLYGRCHVLQSHLPVFVLESSPYRQTLKMHKTNIEHDWNAAVSASQSTSQPVNQRAYRVLRETTLFSDSRTRPLSFSYRNFTKPTLQPTERSIRPINNNYKYSNGNSQLLSGCLYYTVLCSCAHYLWSHRFHYSYVQSVCDYDVAVFVDFRRVKV